MVVVVKGIKRLFGLIFWYVMLIDHRLMFWLLLFLLLLMMMMMVMMMMMMMMMMLFVLLLMIVVEGEDGFDEDQDRYRLRFLSVASG